LSILKQHLTNNAEYPTRICMLIKFLLVNVGPILVNCCRRLSQFREHSMYIFHRYKVTKSNNMNKGLETYVKYIAFTFEKCVVRYIIIIIIFLFCTFHILFTVCCSCVVYQLAESSQRKLWHNILPAEIPQGGGRTFHSHQMSHCK